MKFDPEIVEAVGGDVASITRCWTKFAVAAIVSAIGIIYAWDNFAGGMVILVVGVLLAFWGWREPAYKAIAEVAAAKRRARSGKSGR